MHHLLETWFHWVLNGGYLGIIVLMAMESSIFPVPSEIVIPPAAFLAYLGDKAYRLEPELLTSPDALVRFIHGQSKGILLVVALFAALYMLSLRLMKPRSSR